MDILEGYMIVGLRLEWATSRQKAAPIPTADIGADGLIVRDGSEALIAGLTGISQVSSMVG